jgi:hypothetical protein
MIELIGIIINLLALIYVLGVIPKRVKQVSNKCDIISKNQGIIEKKIK